MARARGPRARHRAGRDVDWDEDLRRLYQVRTPSICQKLSFMTSCLRAEFRDGVSPDARGPGPGLKRFLCTDPPRTPYCTERVGQAARGHGFPFASLRGGVASPWSAPTVGAVFRRPQLGRQLFCSPSPVGGVRAGGSDHEITKRPLSSNFKSLKLDMLFGSPFSRIQPLVGYRCPFGGMVIFVARGAEVPPGPHRAAGVVPARPRRI